MIWSGSAELFGSCLSREPVTTMSLPLSPWSVGVAAPVGVAAGGVVWSLPVVCAKAAPGSAHKAASAVPEANTRRSEVEPAMTESPLSRRAPRRSVHIKQQNCHIAPPLFLTHGKQGHFCAKSAQNVARVQHDGIDAAAVAGERKRNDKGSRDAIDRQPTRAGRGMTATAGQIEAQAIVPRDWRRYGLYLLLGFAAGLPFYMFNAVLLYRLAKHNIDIGTVGFFAWVALLPTFKIDSEPLLDMYDAQGVARFRGT